jgi:hypothetical protein
MMFSGWQLVPPNMRRSYDDQSSEAEDDQLTQVRELEIERISSTLFIL